MTTSQRTARTSLAPTPFRNAPVSRLPPEILAHIFLRCARRDYYEGWDDIGVPRWVKVTYVCSCWRRVALNCPALWSYLFIASPLWTDALLIRSKQVPLWTRISTPGQRTISLDFLTQVIPHAKRLRECQVTAECEDVHLVLSMLPLESAPLLRSLAFTLKHRYCRNLMTWEAEVEFDLDEDTELDIPYTVDGDTPTFDPSYIPNHFLSWCSPTLTVLRLENLHFVARPTIAELKVILARMPNLERLYLDHAIRCGRYEQVVLETEKVHLPRLAHLFVVAPFSRVVRVLSFIDIPVTTQVRLGCSLTANSDENDYATFYSFVSQRFSKSENEPVRTLVVENTLGIPTILISKLERKCDCQEDQWTSFFKDCDCDIPLQVHIYGSRRVSHGDDLLVGICQNVPLERLETLVMSGYLQLDWWFDFLWRLPELRYIEFIGGYLLDIATLLSPSLCPLLEDSDGSTDRRTAQPFAPLLKELCLIGVCTPLSARCGGDPSMHGSHAILLRDALASRRAAGQALERLFIQGHLAFSQNKVTLLREVVPQVEVQSYRRLLDNERCEDCKDFGKETADSSSAPS